MSKRLKSILLSIGFGIIFSVGLVTINHKMQESKNEITSETSKETKDEIKDVKTEVVKEDVKTEIEEDKKEDEAQTPKEIVVKNNTTANKINNSNNVVYSEPEVKEENVQNNLTSNNSVSNSSNLGTFKLTAYCNCSQCCGQWAGGATASGTMPSQGRTIAVDPSVIPLGTSVTINGNTYVAEDTGSAIKGNKIDIYFDNHSDAMNFGVQYAEVYK